MKLLSFVSRLGLTGILLYAAACRPAGEESKTGGVPSPHRSSTAAGGNGSAAVQVALAPFDRYPGSTRFPLEFRFSSPVAPSDRTARENFDQVTLSPTVAGTWSWTSDSTLTFVPNDGWLPQQQISVGLGGLVTSDGTQGSKVAFAPEQFSITTPKPTAALARCEMTVFNKSPLIQRPAISVRLNYPFDPLAVGNYEQLSIRRAAGQENLELGHSSDLNRLRLDFEGPQLFRPENPGTVEFTLKAGLPVGPGHTLPEPVTCTLPISAASWDELAEQLKDPPKVKPVVVLQLTAPTREIGEIDNARSQLRLTFKDAWKQQVYAHGKAKGIRIEHGVSLSPDIQGEWTTDPTDANALFFIPAQAWPVGQQVSIAVDPQVFPELDFKSTQATFYTPRLSGQFEYPQLYTDPTNPQIRKITSAISFSHLVDPAQVQSNLEMLYRIEPQKSFRGPGVKRLAMKSKVDEKNPWKIYVESEPIELPDEPGEIWLLLGSGIVARDGGSPTQSAISTQLAIPSKRDIFTIASVTASVVKNQQERLERVLTLDVSEPVSPEALLGALEVYVLPDCRLEENAKLCRDNEQLGDQALVYPEILAQAARVTLSPVPRDETTAPNLHHFVFQAPGKREVFVRVQKGLASETKFKLADDFRSVLYATPFPKQLNIMHEGALLSLSGDRKLGVAARNMREVKFELSRILPANVHHLISVTYGKFSQPYFNYGSIQLDQLAERVSYVEGMPNRDPGETIYTTVDFNKFVKSGAAPHGLFVLKVAENKKETKRQTETEECEGEDCSAESSSEDNSECEEGDEECSNAKREDSRLVLITDLGMLVKDALSGEHDVYVMSFRTGEPVAGATVKLLGANGVPLFVKTTDESGHAAFPPTKDLKREKAPLLYVVEHQDDYSFIPFARNDRQLNFTRFDTGGVVNSDEAEGLRALLFSDRGIYRPGEEARFGIIVRKRNLELAGVNVPLEVSLSDPRGVEILKRKFTLSRLGFEDFRWTSENALTGTYSLGVYLVRGKSGEKRSLLGSTSFRVDEFQPDKLAVKAEFAATEAGASAPPAGWANRKGEFKVNVANLFGTPAVQNKVEGTLLLQPWDGTFSEYPDYLFYQRDEKVQLPTEAESLGEALTDERGTVAFPPDLDRFAERAFQIQFAAEAFEKDSGRSVIANAAKLVSDAPSFLGWKADGSLDYINKAAGRKVQFVAIGPDLKQIELKGVALELIETRMISTLVKQPNGNLQYEMTAKKSTVWNGTLDISNSGAEFALATALPGDFTLQIKDAAGKDLNSIHYVVHGEGNTTFMADRKAEVGIKLKKASVEPDQELELSINTPYVGAGLITIEREKVYAAKWFKADTLSSVQTIRVPRGVIGNAYVSVAFVRSLDSKDIFATPLSYGVQPFSIAKSEYTAAIALTVPERVKPGTSVPVHYALNAPGKFLLYAVDEGILQFARYKNPRPVESFVPKRALEVETFQILDLLLPDQRIVDSLSSPGGDEDVGLGKFKNPFARKRRAPMAFWSGVLPDGQQQGDVSIPVPEYFNGTIRVIAIAVTEKKVGIESAKTISQADFVIDPQAPYFVSPGDEFEIGATVANTVAGSGPAVELQAEVIGSAAFDAVEQKPIALKVPEGQDKVFRIRMKAKDVLGEQTFRIKVMGLGREATATESISIRPPQAYRTEISGGVYRPDKDGPAPEKSLPSKRELYSELRDVSASVSMTPLTVGRALMSYLKTYPYGCTEQLVSAAFPAVLFGPNPEMGLSDADVAKFTKRAFQSLSSRQRADGAFGLWDAYSAPDPIFSVYGAHFLLEAREHGLEIPDTVWQRSLTWLESLAQKTEYSLQPQFAQAYALYVRARAGQVVTKDVQALVAQLDRQWQNKWRSSALATFLAGSLKLMQMDAEADALLKRPPEVWNPALSWPADDAALTGSIYTWIAAKHFAEPTWMSPLDAVVPVARMIDEKQFNTFNAAFAVMGLDATAAKLAENAPDVLKIASADSAGAVTPLTLTGVRVLQSAVPESAKKLLYSGQSGKLFFYELSETGFDRKAPAPVASGLTIVREVKDEAGKLRTEFSLDEKPEVTLSIKADTELPRVAVLELLPGGFEIDLSEDGLAQRKSLKPGPNTWSPDFIEIQEDRIIFFGNLPKDTATFTYRLKPLSRGAFTFAAPYAEGMYDMKKRFLGEPTFISVK